MSTSTRLRKDAFTKKRVADSGRNFLDLTDLILHLKENLNGSFNTFLLTLSRILLSFSSEVLKRPESQNKIHASKREY